MSTENPKHYAGLKKIPFGDVPGIVMAEVAVAMHEGARKYGAFNYRKDPILASDYYSAAQRHLLQWFELGEDWDGESGLSHITKAIACLTVLRDAQINGMVKDDRPPQVNRAKWKELQEKVKDLQEMYPTVAKRVTSWDDTKANDAQPSKSFGPSYIVQERFFDQFGRLELQRTTPPDAEPPVRRGSATLADVETGEYFEPPVTGYTR